MSDLTAEQREEIRKTAGEVIDLAARKIDSGRSSMPIRVDDALILAGCALAALDLTNPTPARVAPTRDDAGTDEQEDA